MLHSYRTPTAQVFIVFGVFLTVIAFNISFFDFEGLLTKTSFYFIALALTIKKFDFIIGIFRILIMVFSLPTLLIVGLFFISTPELKEVYVLLDAFISCVIGILMHGSQTKLDKE